MFLPRAPERHYCTQSGIYSSVLLYITNRQASLCLNLSSANSLPFSTSIIFRKSARLAWCLDWRHTLSWFFPFNMPLGRAVGGTGTELRALRNALAICYSPLVSTVCILDDCNS